MRAAAVARRYAGALVEATEPSRLQAVEQALRAIAQLWQRHRELRVALRSPLVRLEEREQVLRALARRLGAPVVLERFLELLVRRRRLELLPEVAEAVSERVAERLGVQRAEVVTAGPLPPRYLEELKSVLEQVTGKRVTLRHRQDPNLLGGVVARVGDLVFDGSVRGRLQEIREQLLSGP